MQLKGIYPIVPTPFDEEGRVDSGSIERLAAFVAECGAQGPAILGVMGEGHKLNEAERAQVIQTIRAMLPTGMALVVGVRAAGTDLAIQASQQAESLGADALLVGPPPVQNDEVIFRYFQRVAQAVTLPIIVHDYPTSTGILMSPNLIGKIYSDVENVRYVKLEDPPTGLKMDRLRHLAGDALGIFGALGGMYAFEELDRGAVGIMTGFAYPELLVEIFDRYQSDDIDGASTLFYDILPLIRFEFQPGLGVHLRKHILVQRGVFQTATVRHPGSVADAKTLEHLDRILDYLRYRGYAV